VHGEEGGVDAVQASLDGGGGGHDRCSACGFGVDIDVLCCVSKLFDPGLVIIPLHNLHSRFVLCDCCVCVVPYVCVCFVMSVLFYVPVFCVLCIPQQQECVVSACVLSVEVISLPIRIK
jgi:hypothetical protein